MAGWSSNVYVRVGNIEFGIYIAEYGLVGLDNPFQVDIDEEIVGVNMLFDEAFHLQECRKEVPLILDTISPSNSSLGLLANQSDIGLEAEVTYWAEDFIRVALLVARIESLHT